MDPGPGAAIRVLLVNPYPILRRALAGALEEQPELALAGDVGTLAEARDAAASAHVVVTSLILPDGDGVDLVRECAGQRGIRTVVLAMTDDRAWVNRARRAGAAAILTTHVPIEVLVGAIRGDEPPTAGPAIAPDVDEPETSLTPRERQVLRCLAEGMTGPATAAALHISEATQRRHMDNIRRKLGARSQAHAVLIAARRQLLDIG